MKHVRSQRILRPLVCDDGLRSPFKSYDGTSVFDLLLLECLTLHERAKSIVAVCGVCGLRDESAASNDLKSDCR